MNTSDKSPLQLPLSAPLLPIVRSQHEWDMLSPEAKASILFSWSEFWLNRSTPATAGTSSTPIVLPIPSTDGETSTVGWKQSPSADEREAMRDGNWK